jgi:hypothetical protein
MTDTILISRNEGYGFFGTMRHWATPEDAWNIALAAVAEATGCAFHEVRDFLDSRYGRHFADEVIGKLSTNRGPVAPRPTLQVAIDLAVKQWSAWQISKPTSRATGIPMGSDYLTGFVIHAAITTEAEEQS